MEWTGWVQSRIRRLVFNLSHAAEVRLWPIEYRPSPEEGEEQLSHQVWFWIGVKRPHFVPNRQRNGAPLVDMGPQIKEFRQATPLCTLPSNSDVTGVKCTITTCVTGVACTCK